MGGGGGSPQTTTTTSGIDDEFKPYLERVLSDVTNRYESQVAKGPDAIVAAMTPEQEAALEAKADQSRAMIDYNPQEAIDRNLKNLRGDLAGQAGSMIGGARFQKATEGALADRALELDERRMRTQAAGATGLGEVGSTKQAYEQQRMDAPDTAAARYFGYLSGAPQKQVSTSSGGGGK